MVNTDGKNGGWTGVIKEQSDETFKQFMTDIDADRLAANCIVRQSEGGRYIVERSLSKTRRMKAVGGKMLSVRIKM